MSVGGDALRRQVDLPVPVAVWVLSAHALALLSPVLLLVVAWDRRTAVEAVFDRPAFLLVAAALLLVGSAFEAAQNTEDRWYYTGPYAAFADAVFTVLITAGLAALGIAARGDRLWPWLVGAGAVLLSVALYRRGAPGFPALGLAGVGATVGLHEALQQPVVVLLLVATGFLNAFFLDLVVRTRAQSLHGAIALSNGVGLAVVAYAVAATAEDSRLGWPTVLAVAVVVVGAALAALPVLRRLQPTPRPSAAADRVGAPA